MNVLKNTVFFFVVHGVFLFFPVYTAAGGAPFTRLVTAPTAGSLQRGHYALETRLFENGGVVQVVDFGVHDLIDIGVSYGGSSIIGSSPVVWQPHVGFRVRVRIVEETMTAPALSVGFDSQGEGTYISEGGRNRFKVKSRGGYLVVSRNYKLLGDLGLHAGVNYSLETDDGDEDPSFWAGFNKSIFSAIELCAEYDFAVNDNESRSMNADTGYLNCALRWSFGGSFTIEFNLDNILRNSTLDAYGTRIDEPEPTRGFRFLYRGSI